MTNKSTLTIQDVMDRAKAYKQQGLSVEEAIQRAIASVTQPLMDRNELSISNQSYTLTR